MLASSKMPFAIWASAVDGNVETLTSSEDFIEAEPYFFAAAAASRSSERAPLSMLLMA
jgi:hypothetical protein